MPATPIGAAAHAGAADVVAMPGDRAGDVSVTVYFDVPDAGAVAWNYSVFDGAGAFVGESNRILLAQSLCGQRAQYCGTVARSAGWNIAAGVSYSFSVAVAYSDNTAVVAPRSNAGRARALPATVPLAAAQTYGCSCPNSSGRTGGFNAPRADPVNTATGAFSEAGTDLSMPGPGVAFHAARSYSSDNTATSVLGAGWSWAYDMRLSVVPAGPVTFTAEDGSRTVYQRAADGSYTPPAGARSVLSGVAGGFLLLTPEQRSLAFDPAGRLLSIKDTLGHGLVSAMPAVCWRR